VTSKRKKAGGGTQISLLGGNPRAGGRYFLPAVTPTAPAAVRVVYAGYERAAGDAMYRVRSQASDRWAGATADTWIGLFVVCHEKLYKFRPVSLNDKTEFAKARGVVRRFVGRYFQRPDQVADYMGWFFRRERGAIERDPQRRRASWTLLFSGAAYDDWRVYQKRQAEARGR
jgi:hypothetical protein